MTPFAKMKSTIWLVAGNVLMLTLLAPLTHAVVDTAALNAADDRVAVTAGRPGYNRQTRQASMPVTLTNTSAEALHAPIVFEVLNPNPNVANADDVSASGNPVFVFAGDLAPGAGFDFNIIFNGIPRFTLQQAVFDTPAGGGDVEAPVVIITNPPDGAAFAISPIDLSFSATDNVGLATLSVNGVAVTPNGPSYSVPVDLVENLNTITVNATDATGNSASASIAVSLDNTPPNVQILSPADGAVFSTADIEVSFSAADASGIATLTLNGIPVALNGDTFIQPLTLVEGLNTIAVAAGDPLGNTATTSIQVSFDPPAAPPQVTISSPLDGALVGNSPLTVSGSVISGSPVAVLVNGQAAIVDATNNFSAALPLAAGTHTVTAVATDADAQTGQDSIQITVDLDPPVVSFVQPTNGAVVTSSLLDVELQVSDDVGVTAVNINGVAAVITGTLASATIPVVVGDNVITAIATDLFGRSTSTSIAVRFDNSTSDDLESPVVIVKAPFADSILSVQPFNVAGTATDNVGVTRVTVNGVDATLQADTFMGAVDGLLAGPNTITVEAFDLAGNRDTVTFNVIADLLAPTISVVAPTATDTTVSPVLFRVQAEDDVGIDRVLVNGLAASLVGDTYEAAVSVANGLNEVRVVAVDVANRSALETVNITFVDAIAPQIAIATPTEGNLIVDRSKPVVVNFSDESGVDTTSFQIAHADSSILFDCVFANGGATCTPQSAYSDGNNLVTADINDLAGNSNSALVNFTVDGSPVEIDVQTPVADLITSEEFIQVTGTAGPDVVTVDVNGIGASLAGGAFSATVPLREGKNMLVAVGRKASGRTGSDSVDITRDNTAAIVRITSPEDGFIAVNPVVDITGQVNDFVTGGVNPVVTVNGVEATVLNQTFMVVELPLVNGPNVVTARSVDRAGNQSEHSITIEFREPAGDRMVQISGTGQGVNVTEALPNPLVAGVRDALGNPVAGRLINFEVTRNNGVLLPLNGATDCTAVNPATAVGTRSLVVPTTGAGQAAVCYIVGDTSGEGNNRVRASALGVEGSVEFCAGAAANPADKILMVSGDDQRGVTGDPLADPFEALVVDIDGNPVEGVAVTFEAVVGGGLIDGTGIAVRLTNSLGLARVVLALGQDPGLNNNIVVATFPGLTKAPATFTASGLVPAEPENTAFSGIVLDNAFSPIPNALVEILDTTLSVRTDEDGEFLITGVPVGRIHLRVDPAGSPRPETFPPIEFETVTIAGQVNTLGMPISLPALETEGSRIVGGDETVTIRMPGVNGMSITVAPRSVTFPDGSTSGQITLSQVQLDKVPMPPPSGTIFMPPAWTVQPHGVVFDPPAAVSIPNDGLPPGRVIDIFQFDHALNEFVNIGKGTVSEDASVILSDPGFGIVRSGWGGCGQPQPPTTCTCQCDDRNECTADSCSGQPNCACTNAPLDQPTDSQCTEGCVNGMPVNTSDGGACDDGKFCTSAGGTAPGPDLCKDGVCDGKAIPFKKHAGGSVGFDVTKFRELLKGVELAAKFVPGCSPNPFSLSGAIAFDKGERCCESQQRIVDSSTLGGSISGAAGATCRPPSPFSIPGVGGITLFLSISASASFSGSGTVDGCEDCGWEVKGTGKVTVAGGITAFLASPEVLEIRGGPQGEGSLTASLACGTFSGQGCLGPVAIVGQATLISLFSVSVEFPIPNSQVCWP